MLFQLSEIRVHTAKNSKQIMGQTEIFDAAQLPILKSETIFVDLFL